MSTTTLQGVTEDWTDDCQQGECERCGKTARVHLTEDPYTNEMSPEDDNPATWWCFACWGTRSGDR